MTKTTTYLVTGDVGGTTSRMSLYEMASTGKSSCSRSSSCSSVPPPIRTKFYRNAERVPDPKDVDPKDPNLFIDGVVKPFLEYCWEGNKDAGAGVVKLVPIEECVIVACLATAGVVSNNRVNMTNLGNLLVDGDAVAREIPPVASCRIINDFVATGYGCLTLRLSPSFGEVRHLSGPELREADMNDPANGPKVCVGAGTGLGECYLTPGDDSSYSCYASEGGHVDYAPGNDVEVKLWKHLCQEFSGAAPASKKKNDGDHLDGDRDRISVERIVSGIGLANVYDFLAKEFPNLVDTKMHETYRKAEMDRRGKIISDHAKEHLKILEENKKGGKSTATVKDNLCHMSMSVLMRAYGNEVGCAAVKFIPTGGMFVTGGLTPKNMEYIDGGAGKDTPFLSSYLNRGRVSSVVDRVPLYAVLVEDVGIRGAHKAASMEYEKLLSRVAGGDANKDKKKSAACPCPCPCPFAAMCPCTAVCDAVGKYPCLALMASAFFGYAVAVMMAKRGGVAEM